ncbi:MAG TPA: DUF998 domain-containing protein [Microbacterium sp.]|nr:DUF998 domain-containing protein [Microbacterium sp.]
MTDIPLEPLSPRLQVDSTAAAADHRSARSVESLALVVGAAAFGLAAVAALIAFRFEPAPIAGPGSVGQFSAVTSAVVALLGFGAGRLVVQRRGQRAPLRVLDYLDIVALAIAHAVIALLGWTLAASIMEQAFIGAVVFPLAVIALAGAVAAVTAYMVFLSATHMDLPLLAAILAVFLAVGLIASMLGSSDPDWWVDNLSALGMTTSTSARAFSITLIVAGFIITTIARYVTRDIPTSNPRGVPGARVCLVLVGLFLMGVGIFPVDTFFGVHTGVTIAAVVAFGVLVIRMPVWLTDMPRVFVVVGWLFLAITLVFVVFFFTGYYTLTAVELVGGTLVFTWLILFIRNVAAVQTDAGARG